MLLTTDTILGPKPPQCAYAESFRVVRANLTALSQREPFHSLLITSATPREGKTTVALNLATTFALAGRTTLIVDTDTLRQGLSRLLGIAGTPGLTDLCEGTASPDAVVRPSELPHLLAVSAGTHTEGTQELASRPSMGEALQQLRSHADLVVLDGTPTLGFGNTLALAPLVDMVAVVARARRDAEMVRQALLSLVEVGANVGGVIVNDILPADSLMASSYYSYYTPET